MRFQTFIAIVPVLLGACVGPPPEQQKNNTSNNTTNAATNAATNNTTSDPINVTTNVNPGSLLYLLKVESTTTAVDACATGDPGPDLFAVGLEDDSGASLAWGRVVWADVQMAGNEHADARLSDGNEPGLCPDMFNDSVLSLGCDGKHIVVKFVGDAGQDVGFSGDSEWVVRVYEWGGQCTTGTIDDTYSVSVCTDRSDAETGETSSCNVMLIVDGDGETAAELAF